MMMKIIIAAALVVVTVVISALICKEHEENKVLRRLLKNETDRQKEAAQITAEANKTKADARTDNHADNVQFMADKLHEYASK